MKTAEKLPPIAINRKARFDYFIEERFEAGISLLGWEVKSMRAGKLLLNRRQLDHMVGAVERRGYTIVPLELYWKEGRAKLEIGLAKGKKQHDKRATDKDRDWQRDKSRIMKAMRR